MNLLTIHPLAWAKNFSTDEIRRAIGNAARAGFDQVVVPLRNTQAIDIEGVRRTCEAARIRPIATAIMDRTADPASAEPAVRQAGGERLRRALAMTRDLGSSHLGGVLYTALARATEPSSPDGFSHAAAALSEAAESGSRSSISLVIEATNRYENNLINTAAQAVALAEATGRENVLVHLDSYHMNIEEADPIAALRKAAPRLGYFEFSESHRGLLGTGRVDVDGLAHVLREIDYRGPIGIEAFSAAILEPAVAAGFAVWSSNFDDGDALAHHAIERLRQAFLKARPISGK